MESQDLNSSFRLQAVHLLARLTTVHLKLLKFPSLRLSVCKMTMLFRPPIVTTCLTQKQPLTADWRLQKVLFCRGFVLNCIRLCWCFCILPVFSFIIELHTVFFHAAKTVSYARTLVQLNKALFVSFEQNKVLQATNLQIQCYYKTTVITKLHQWILGYCVMKNHSVQTLTLITDLTHIWNSGNKHVIEFY